MLLLDTCTFLWIVSAPDKLGPNTKKMILQYPNDIFLSAISAFEIAIKARKGDLKLPYETEKWFADSLEFHGVNELPLSSEIVIRSAHLPLLHRDPCDRMIISTSQIHDLILLTPDSLITQYEGLKVLW